MLWYIVSLLDSIRNFLFNNFPNIAVNVYNVNPITQVIFLVMRFRKLGKFPNYIDLQCLIKVGSAE